MDLLIHVGLHKTGTTSVQDCLFRHREELLSHHILYPQSGLYGAQHALFPGSLIPNHFYLDRIERKLDYNYYVSLLHEEVSQCQPALVVLSSEVFSEIISQTEGCAALISAIGDGFSATRLLVTLRNSRQLALSALKHAVREKRKPWIDNPVGCYLDALVSTETVERFWMNLGLPVVSKYLEDAQSDLTQYYLGGIFDEYSPSVSALFQGDRDGSSGEEGAKLNADSLSPSTYLSLFLVANQSRNFSLQSKRIFALIGLASAKKSRFDILKESINNGHLLKYLNHFSVDAIGPEVQIPQHISLQDKISALEGAGLAAEVVSAAIDLVADVNQLMG